MSESMIQCPICGKQFPTWLQEISDNGNPICSECAEKEKEESK